MNQLSESPAVRKYAALDGWRGICALLVAALHFNAASHIRELPIVANAHLFVDFFFVLSGFVVSFAYIDRLESLAQVGIMLWRRIARLWPLHMALLIAFILFELVTAAVGILSATSRRGELFNSVEGFFLSAIPTHIIMLHSMGLHSIATWNVPSWSISAEFWATAVFAIVFLYFQRSTIVLPLAFAAFGAAVIAFLAPELMMSHHDFGFFRCLYGFFIGHIVFRMHEKFSLPDRAATRYEVLAVVAIIVFVSAAGVTPYALAAPIVFGATVWIFAAGNGAISCVLLSKPLQYLGLWSYSIYMINALIVLTINRTLTLISSKTGLSLTTQVQDRSGIADVISFGGPIWMDIVCLAYLALVIYLAAYSWLYIEIPAQKKMNAMVAAPASSMCKDAAPTAGSRSMTDTRIVGEPVRSSI